jgi:hypothetical protein
MSNDPLAIPLERVADLLRGLGLDPVNLADIRSVHIESGAATVVRCRRNESGGMVVTDNDVLTETVTIRIDAEPSTRALGDPT